MCEVGIPYSDPIADGPVIQASYTRALENEREARRHSRTCSARSRPRLPPRWSRWSATRSSTATAWRPTPTSAGNRRRRGDRARPARSKKSPQLAEICRSEDFSLIQLVTPTTPRDRALRIADTSSGFHLLRSVTGITGERTELPPELVDNVGWLREQTPLPICIGFGISRPEHVRMLAPVADGLIVGSAIVRRIAQRLLTKGREPDACRRWAIPSQTLLAARSEWAPATARSCEVRPVAVGKNLTLPEWAR